VKEDEDLEITSNNFAIEDSVIPTNEMNDAKESVSVHPEPNISPMIPLESQRERIRVAFISTDTNSVAAVVSPNVSSTKVHPAWSASTSPRAESIPDDDGDSVWDIVVPEVDTIDSYPDYKSAKFSSNTKTPPVNYSPEKERLLNENIKLRARNTELETQLRAKDARIRLLEEELNELKDSLVSGGVRARIHRKDKTPTKESKTPSTEVDSKAGNALANLQINIQQKLHSYGISSSSVCHIVHNIIL
jgi:hypothetical protein